MSECVVRMKTPSSCYVCPLRIACVLYKKWLANEADMPCVYDDGCLIICALPEGHGRLIDADVILQYLREKTAMFDAVDGKMELVSLTIRNDLQGFIKTILETPTIVPAERREE